MFEALHPRRPGSRVAVWIVAAIALTSIATGVGAILTRPALETAARSAIFRPSQSSAGPSLASPCSLPPGECVGGTGWRTSPPSSSLPCPGHTVSSVPSGVGPLVVLSVGGLTVLVATSGRFTRSSTLDATQIGAFLSIIGVLCYPEPPGVRAQKRVRRGHDHRRRGLLHHRDREHGRLRRCPREHRSVARLFAISLVVLGPATLAATVGSLFGPALDTPSPEPVARQRLVSIPTLPQPDTVRRPAQKSSFSGPMRRSHRSSTPSRPARRSRS